MQEELLSSIVNSHNQQNSSKTIIHEEKKQNVERNKHRKLSAHSQRNSEQHQSNKDKLSKKLKRMYKFPASVNEAKVHKRAFLNGYKSSKSIMERDNNKQEQELTKLCPCCQNFVNTVEIPLCYSTYPKKTYACDPLNRAFLQFVIGQQVFQMKTGDALFFCFIKLVLTYLMIRFFVLDAYNLFTNHLGQYCSNYQSEGSDKICVNELFSVLATANKRMAVDQDYFFLYDILALVFTIFSIGFFIYGRIKLKELYQWEENEDITEDDYTILIEDIPHISFDRKDALVKDINLEYENVIKKLVSKKIREWLNQMYAKKDKTQSEDPLEQQFIEIFTDQLQKNEAKLFDEIVTSVNLCYDLSELENLETIREKLVQEFIEEEGDKEVLENNLFDDNFRAEEQEKEKKGQFYISHIPHQIEFINDHFIKVCQKISEVTPLTSAADLSKTIVVDHKGRSDGQFKISRFVGKAFVSLRFQHYKYYLLSQYMKDNGFMRTNGNAVSLKLSGAQKPNDIYWNNMKIPDDFRYKQIRNSIIIVILTVAVSFGIVCVLRNLENVFNSHNKKKTIFQSIYLMVLPLFTFVINLIIDWGLHELTQFEKHKTKSEELSSSAIKTIFAKFMNTSVVYAFLFFNGHHLNPLAENGLVSVLMSLIILTGILNWGKQLFLPKPIKHYLRAIQRRWKGRDYDKMKKVNLFQIQLNKQLEDPQFDFAQAYSYYLQMVYIISFYGYMVPLSTPIIIVYFIAQYWIDKYNLLRRFSSPVDMSYYLTDLIWKSLQFSLLLTVVGHWVWGFNVHYEYCVTSWCCNFLSIGLAVGYVIVSYFNILTQKKWYKQCTGKQYHYSKKPYEKSEQLFEKTYRSENPATAFLSTSFNQQSLSVENIVKGVFKLGTSHDPVSENEVELQTIWRNQQDQTVKYQDMEKPPQPQLQDFTTLCCCC